MKSLLMCAAAAGMLALPAEAAAALPAPASTPITLKFQSRVSGAVPGIGKNTRALARRVVSSANHAAAHIPLTDFINRTDLQWYSTIQVGTPPQRFTVLFDTGSADILLPQDNCTTCDHHHLFSPSKSHTFSASPGIVEPLTFGTGGDPIPLTEPESANGRVVTDAVRLGNLCSPRQNWLMCDEYADVFNHQPIDGILGLSPANVSFLSTDDYIVYPFYWQLYYSGQLPSPEFGWYGPAGHTTGGELTLGGIDARKVLGGAAGVTTLGLDKTLSTESGSWIVQTPRLLVDGKTVLNTSTGQPLPAAASLLDTGTAFLQAPDAATAAAIYAHISPLIHELSGTGGAWGAPCAAFDSFAADLTFEFVAGEDPTASGPGVKRFNATMPRDFFNLGPYPGLEGICQAPINSQPGTYPQGDVPKWILGSPLLKAYYTVWDGLALTVGFGELAKGCGR